MKTIGALFVALILFTWTGHPGPVTASSRTEGSHLLRGHSYPNSVTLANNFGTNAFTTAPSLNTPREALGAATAPCEGATSESCIYAVGGDDSTSQWTFLDSVEMYRPSTNEWTYVASLLQPEQFAAVASGPCEGAISSTCLYTAGGYGDQSPYILNVVQMYNPSNNSWSYVAPLPADEGPYPGLSGAAAASAPCDGATTRNCLYVYGGDPGYGYPGQTDVMMFDPQGNSWSLVTSMGHCTGWRSGRSRTLHGRFDPHVSVCRCWSNRLQRK